MDKKIRELATLNLDIGCGENKQENFIGMDKRKVKGVDIVHDLEVFPYPLDDSCCNVVMASHILEHIKPHFAIPLFDEIWRILKPDGQFISAVPYAGSNLYWQDPTHCNGFIPATFQYFDPEYPLYQIYKPKPWKIIEGFPTWQVTGNMECMMRAIKNGALPPLGINVNEKIGIEEKL